MNKLAYICIGVCMVGSTFYPSITFAQSQSLPKADIIILQDFLEQKGFLVMSPTDTKGNFGPKTKAALIEYQKSVGLPAEGVYGALTKAKIKDTTLATAPVFNIQPSSILTESPEKMVTESRLNQIIDQLKQSLIVKSVGYSAPAPQTNFAAIALSQKIDQLTNTLITTPTITGGSITNASISGGTMSGVNFSGLTLFSGGNVGIGTTTPLAALSIQGSSGSSSQLLFAVASSTGQSILGLDSNGLSLFSNDPSMRYPSNRELLSVVSTVSSLLQSPDQFNQVGLFGGNFTLNVTGSQDLSGLNGNPSGYITGTNSYVKAVASNSGKYKWLTGIAGEVDLGGNTYADRVYGLDMGVYPNTSQNSSQVVGARIITDSYGSGTITTQRGLEVRTYVESPQIVTDNIGIHVFDGGSDGTVTNQYGIKIGQHIVGTTNSWNIYSEGATSKNYFAGKVAVATTTPWRSLAVTGTVGFDGLTAGAGAGSLCLSSNKEVTYSAGATCTVSSGRFKYDIYTSSTGLEFVNKLRPVTFKYNADVGVPGEQFGFIAEEVEALDPRLVVHDAEGLPFSVRYENLTAVLAKAIQELSAQVNGIVSWFTVRNNNLCVDDVCVTKDQFKQILINGGAQQAAVPTLSTPPPPIEITTEPTSQEEVVVEEPKVVPIVEVTVPEETVSTSAPSSVE